MTKCQLKSSSVFITKYLQFLKAFETGPISAVWIREKNETPVSIAQVYPATDENLNKKCKVKSVENLPTHHDEASMNFMSGVCLVTAMLVCGFLAVYLPGRIISKSSDGIIV